MRRRVAATLRALVPAAAKRFIVEALCNGFTSPVVVRMLGQTISSDGLPIDIRNNRISNKTKIKVFLGLYERAERDFVQKYLPPDLDVIELGASIGVVSSEIARKLEVGHKLVSVEADAELLDVLNRNVRANSPVCQAVSEQAAVMDSRFEQAFVEFRRDRSGNTGGRLASSSHEPGADIFQVPVITVKTICEKHAISEFTLVMDIEGAEASVIYGDVDDLAGCRVLIAELHATTLGGRSVTPAKMKDRLLSLGFRHLASYGNVCAFERSKDQHQNA